jgi:hypothetical protein
MQQFSKFSLAPESQPPGSLPPAAWKECGGIKGREKIRPSVSLTLSVKVGPVILIQLLEIVTEACLVGGLVGADGVKLGIYCSTLTYFIYLALEGSGLTTHSFAHPTFQHLIKTVLSALITAYER